MPCCQSSRGPRSQGDQDKPVLGKTFPRFLQQCPQLESAEGYIPSMAMGAARVRLDLSGFAPHSALCIYRDIWQFTACSGSRALSSLGKLKWLQFGLRAKRIWGEQ